MEASSIYRSARQTQEHRRRIARLKGPFGAGSHLASWCALELPFLLVRSYRSFPCLPLFASFSWFFGIFFRVVYVLRAPHFLFKSWFVTHLNSFPSSSGLQLRAKPMFEAVEWIERDREFWEVKLDALSPYLDNQTQNEKNQKWKIQEANTVGSAGTNC